VHDISEEICFAETALKMRIKNLSEKDESLHCLLLVAVP